MKLLDKKTKDKCYLRKKIINQNKINNDRFRNNKK